MIKISVRDIPSKGLDIDQNVAMEDIGLSAQEADIRSVLNVKAHLEKVDGFVIADTHIKAEFGYTCARCLQELSAFEERSYTIDFELTEGMEEVDLGEEIRQEIILANPARILCKKGCKGICPKCGANLNIEKCQCQKGTL